MGGSRTWIFLGGLKALGVLIGWALSQKKNISGLLSIRISESLYLNAKRRDICHNKLEEDGKANKIGAILIDMASVVKGGRTMEESIRNLSNFPTIDPSYLPRFSYAEKMRIGYPRFK